MSMKSRRAIGDLYKDAFGILLCVIAINVSSGTLYNISNLFFGLFSILFAMDFVLLLLIMIITTKRKYSKGMTLKDVKKSGD